VTDEDLVEAGKNAAAEGLRLWHLDVRDPSVADLAAHKPEALRWRDVIDWHLQADWLGQLHAVQGQPRRPEWCGVTADDCWIDGGARPEAQRGMVRLDAPAVRVGALPYRTRSTDARTRRPPACSVALARSSGRRRRSPTLPFAIREGDIIVIGRPTDLEKLRLVGRHIEIAIGVDLERGIVHTVSATPAATVPTGKPREGITVSERHIGPGGHNGDHVMWVYRPAPGDLAPST
jgi:hypothetical protein